MELLARQEGVEEAEGACAVRRSQVPLKDQEMDRKGPLLCRGGVQPPPVPVEGAAAPESGGVPGGGSPSFSEKSGLSIGDTIRLEGTRDRRL